MNHVSISIASKNCSKVLPKDFAGVRFRCPLTEPAISILKKKPVHIRGNCIVSINGTKILRKFKSINRIVS